MNPARDADHAARDLKNPSTRIPDLLLASSDGRALPLIPPRHASVAIIVVHSIRCPECSAYLERLVRETSELGVWDMSVSVICSDAPDGAELQRAGHIRVLHDRDGRATQALGEEAAVLIVDAWGEVHERIHIGEEHAFPSMADVVAWARYLATRCPECEGEAL